MAKRNNKQRNNLKPLNLTKDGMIRQARYGGYYHKPKNNSFASGGNIKPINAGSIMQGYVDSNPAHSGDVSKISNPLSSFNPDISGFGMSHLMGGVNLAGNIIGMSQASIDPMISANIQQAQSFNPYSQSKDELMDEWGSHANMGHISRKLAGGKNEGQMGMGALQGAASGAAIGSIVPGIGTAIGAGVGALGSLVGGIFGNRSAKRKLRRANALIDEANIMAQNSFINRAQGIDSQFSHGLMSNYFLDGGQLNSFGPITKSYNPSVIELGYIPEIENIQQTTNNPYSEGGLNTNYSNRIMKNLKNVKAIPQGNLQNIFLLGGRMNQFSLGGEFDLGISMVDTGGTHEENPMGGVPMGVDEEGIPNMVEEGEVIYNDYVFSNRIYADENTLIDNLLNVNYADSTFAKIAEEISKKYEDHPNDPIAKRGLKIEMDRLIAAQEAVKDEEAEEEMGMQLAEAAQGQEQLILGGGIDQNPMLNPGMLGDVMGGLNMDLSGLEEMNPEMMNQDMNLFAEGGDLNEGSENIDNEEIMNAEKSDKDIKGRLSKNHTVKTIAELHGVDVSLIKEQLEKGIEVEYEHTDNKDVARRIAMDHLVELPDYYDRLEAMEKLGERELSGEEDLIDGYNQELMMAQELMMGLEQMMGQGMMGPNMFPDGGWFNKVHGPDFKWGILFTPTPTPKPLSISLLRSGKYNVKDVQQPSQGNIVPVQNTPDTNSFDLSRFQKYNTSINPLDKYASIIGGNPSEVRLPLNHHTVYSKAADERRMREHNKSQQRSGNLQDLRYAPALGAGLMSISDMMGWTNKPDHSYAEMVGRSADGMREYTPDKLGDYLEYTPFDIDYQQNKMAAQAGASRRAMTDLVGGNRGAAMAGLTALDRGAQDAMGDLGILANQYNLQLRQQAAEFNRGTNMFNAQQDMYAHQMNLRREHAQMLAIMNQAQMMMQSDAMSSQAKSANLSNMLQSIGDIGRESFARLMILSNPSLYYSIDSKGNVSYKNGYHQLPPNEKVLVDRAAEIQKYREEIEKLQSKQGEKRETKDNKKAKGGSLKRVKRK